MTLDELFTAAVDASVNLQHERAEALWLEYLARSDLDESHPDFDGVMHNVAATQRDLGKFEAARNIYHKLLARARAPGGDIRFEYGSLHELAMVERFSGDFDKAMSWFGQAEQLLLSLQNTPREDTEALIHVFCERAYLKIAMGDAAEGQALLERGLGLARHTFPQAEARVLQDLGELLVVQGETPRARALLVEAQSYYARQPELTWLSEHLRTLLAELSEG